MSKIWKLADKYVKACKGKEEGRLGMASNWLTIGARMGASREGEAADNGEARSLTMGEIEGCFFFGNFVKISLHQHKGRCVNSHLLILFSTG